MCFLCIVGLSCTKKSDETDASRSSFYLGYRAAEQAKNYQVPIEKEAFLKGVEAQLSGQNYTPEKRQQDEAAFFSIKTQNDSQIRERRARLLEEKISEFKKDSQVAVTSSGIAYRLNKQGPKIQKQPKVVTLKLRATGVEGKILLDQFASNIPGEYHLQNLNSAARELINIAGPGGRLKAWVPDFLLAGEPSLPGLQIGEGIELELEVLKITN